MMNDNDADDVKAPFGRKPKPGAAPVAPPGPGKFGGSKMAQAAAAARAKHAAGKR